MSHSSSKTPTYVLRKMHLGDVDQVSDIERQAFPIPWSPLTYVYEIKQNRDSYMGVVELPNQPAPSLVGTPMERFQVLLRPFRAHRTSRYTVVSYGGMWFKHGEAHISTIASHPAYRSQRLGELMLLGLVAQGVALQADQIVLEVRVGNRVAQNLYLKYGFEVVELIPQYYYDNREDAYLMAIRTVDAAYRALLKRHLLALRERMKFKDTFTRFHLEQLTTRSADDGFFNVVE